MKKIANFVVDKKKYVLLFYVLVLVLSIFGIFKTNVNYDMSKYLPENSSVKKGMEVMSEEFGDTASITVMFDDLSESEQTEIKNEISEMDNVETVMFMQDDENYVKDNHSRYTITLSVDTYSDEAAKVLEKLRDTYGDRKMYVSGAVVDNDTLISTLMNEIPVIAIIAVILIFVILFLLCDSWIEPFLFMMCIGLAIIINMGTNAFLPSVSFMTFATGALLQLGLSMDYSIMLMNRYSQEKKIIADPTTAMKRALVNSFGAITGSSVTTIVGLLVLVFMSFLIGPDMGIVLAKGVFFSLICIFTALPGLIVKFDKLIAKTHKKALKINMSVIMRFVSKARYVIIPVITLITVCAFFIKSDLKISFVKFFDNPDQTAIEEVYGMENQTVLLYSNKESEEKKAELIEWAENQQDVTGVQDYSNTIGKKYSYKEFAEDMDVDETQAQMLYRMYADKDNTNVSTTQTVYELMCFISDEVIGNPAYSDFIDSEQLEKITDSKKLLEDGKTQIDDGLNQLDTAQQEIDKNKEQMKEAGMTDNQIDSQLSDEQSQIDSGKKALIESEGYKMLYTKMDADELSKLMEQDRSSIDGLLKLMRISDINVDNLTIKLEDLITYIGDSIMTDEVFSDAFDDMKKQFADASAEITESKNMMLGDRYNRMIISAAVESEGDKTFKLIENISDKAAETFENDFYLVGDSSMGYEMNNGFSSELNFVTILSIIAILIVVIVTFRSFINSAVLVVVIQAAVFIATAIVCLQGISVNYIALILVQCILMGATIDYGILFLSNYIESRRTDDKIAALRTAMNNSIRTILTSSLILISCCLTVGLIMTQKIIAQTCSIIAYGAICSVLMVILVLPALVYLLDKVIIKSNNKEAK